MLVCVSLSARPSSARPFPSVSGTLVLAAVMATGALGGAGGGVRGLFDAPPWAFLGGALGATYVLTSIIAIPKAGTVVVICSGIVGQMLGSYRDRCIRTIRGRKSAI